MSYGTPLPRTRFLFPTTFLSMAQKFQFIHGINLNLTHVCVCCEIVFVFTYIIVVFVYKVKQAKNYSIKILPKNATNGFRTHAV